MNLKTKTLLVVFLLCFSALFAQDSYLITGNITSEVDNMPLSDVNIKVVDSEGGVLSDFDGNFQIKVKKGDVLQFSFLGFTTQTVVINDQKTLTISLAEDANQLDEIIVVGYGTRKKSDVTGAVSSVTTKELNAFPVLNAAQALQGRAAGVVVQSNNGGEPGAPIRISIRGNTSLNASSSPLIVVDGFVGATMPQASDIKSIEVLKDASSTAIYGSQGANGVIMVTTKKGKKGKISVELNSTYAVQKTANKLDLLDADEFAAYQSQIRTNQGNPNPYVQGTANTDWQDLIYTSGNTANHQVSFSGGTDKLNFYASGNLFKQDGILINSGFDRGTFLTNLDAELTDKLKVGVNLYGSRSKKDGVATQSDGSVTVGSDDVVSLAMRMAPDKGVYNADGSFSTNDAIGDEVDNPYAVATARVDETKTDNFRANLYASYDILKDLNFKTTYGLSTRNRNRGRYQPSTLQVTASGVGGRAIVTNTKRESILSENYLTYNKEIGKGNLTLLAGYSYQKTVNEVYGAEATGFISDSFSFYNLGAAANTLPSASGRSQTEIQSQFGRVNYDYDDKYLITATLRRDGASNFAKNNKYGIFPSAAIGWKVSNEDFLKDSESISNLKLRVSYGETGNPTIQPYQSLAFFEPLYASSNGSTVNAVTPQQPANPNLKWETSLQTNIGIDVGLLNNKISMSLDYYDIDTKDLVTLDNAQLEYNGFIDAPLVNVGDINNTGLEFNINSRNVSNDDFSWTTDFNIATNKTEVIKLNNDADLFFNGAPSYFSHDRTHIVRVGEEVGLFWGYDYAGVFQGGTLPAGTSTLAGGVAGDPLFVDVDGSGDITEADRTTIGNPNADYTFGITNNFTYKDFDLSIFFQGSQGGDVFNFTNVQLFNGDANTTSDYFNSAWTSTNTNTNTPRVGNNSNREISSRFVEDGSYVRLKNIALGYNLPTVAIEKFGLSNLRVSVSAQNLLTFTDYSGLDPEANYFGASGDNNTSSNVVRGSDFGNYPTVKSVNLSVNLRF